MSPGFPVWAIGRVVVPSAEMEQCRREGEGMWRKMMTYFVHIGDSCGSSKWRSLAGRQICGVGCRTHLGRRVSLGSCAAVGSGSRESWSPHQAE